MKFSSSFISLACFVACVAAAPADVVDTTMNARSEEFICRPDHFWHHDRCVPHRCNDWEFRREHWPLCGGHEHWRRDESSVQSEDFMLPPCQKGTYWSLEAHRCVLDACKFFSFRHNNPKACGEEHWTRDESSVQSEDFLLPPCQKGTYWSLEAHRCVLDACRFFSFRHNHPKACGGEHFTRDESSVQSEDYLKPRCHTGKFWHNGRCIPDACSFDNYQRKHKDVCGSDWPESESSVEKRSEDFIRHCGFRGFWNGHRCVPDECRDEPYRREHRGICQ